MAVFGTQYVDPADEEERRRIASELGGETVDSLRQSMAEVDPFGPVRDIAGLTPPEQPPSAEGAPQVDGRPTAESIGRQTVGSLRRSMAEVDPFGPVRGIAGMARREPMPSDPAAAADVQREQAAEQERESAQERDREQRRRAMESLRDGGTVPSTETQPGSMPETRGGGQEPPTSLGSLMSSLQSRWDAQDQDADRERLDMMVNRQDARDDAEAERKRQRRLKIAGLVLGALNPQVGAIVASGSRLVSDEGRRREQEVGQLLQQNREQRQSQEEQRRRQLQDMLQARQQDQRLGLQRDKLGLQDRRIDLQERSLESLDARRQALAEQGEERLGLAERRQNFQEQQAELDRAAAERRARIMAGRRVGRSGDIAGIQRPGGDAASDGDGGITAHHLAVQNILQTRRDLIEPGAQALVEQARERGEDLSMEDAEWQVARSLWSSLPRREQRRVLTRLADAPSATSEAGRTDRERRQVRGHQVPGWTRSDGAPELTAAEQRDARGIASAVNVVSTLTRRMERLAQEISALEAAGSDAGVVSSKVAEARAAHEMIINKLREIGNYGVPQEAELARMESLAPRISAGNVEFLTTSAPRVYAQMRSVLVGSAEDQMRALGYTRGGGRGSGRRYRAGQQIEVNGRAYTLTEEQARRLNERAGAR